MIKAAVIGLAWGQTVLRQLSNATMVRPVLGVDPLDSARAAASAPGVETSPHFDDALAHPDVRMRMSRAFCFKSSSPGRPG
jgi:predicted dehydrogenase